MKTKKRGFSFLAAATFFFSVMVMTPANADAVDFSLSVRGAPPVPTIFWEPALLP